MKSLQLDKPHAVIVIGVQGSGKTFFAEKFAETFNAPYLEQSMFRHFTDNHKSGDELMNKVLSEMVKTARSIILELALSSRNERIELVRSLKRSGYVPLFVWVQIDTPTAMNRTFRSQGISEDQYMQNLKKFTPVHPSEGALVISGKHTFATQAKAVLKKLSSPRQLQQPTTTERKPTARGQIIIR